MDARLSKVLFLIGFLFVLIVTACTQNKSPTTNKIVSTTQAIATSLIKRTITPTNIEIDTNTPLPTHTIIPSLTPSPIPTHPSSYITRWCSDAITSEQENILSSGSILYYWPKADSIMSYPANALYPKTVLPGIPYISVSPYSGTYLWVTTPGVYEVKNSDGKYYQTEHNTDWGFDRQWLLNDRIIIGHLPSEHPTDRKAKDDFYILTLSTGKYNHYHVDLPEYYALNGAYALIASPVYDPTGALVIYGWDNPGTLESGMLLWDIQNEKEIWKRSGWKWAPLTDGISWQYDGSHVFIVAPPIGKESPPEIFSIDREGKETQLSNLGEVFTSTYLIYDLVISPDGKKIAFSVDTKIPSPFNLRSLYVLNTITGEVIDYCVTVDRTMIWSPSSDQLAFISEPIYGEPQLMVLDIESGKKMTIDNRTRGLYGWMNWSPP